MTYALRATFAVAATLAVGAGGTAAWIAYGHPTLALLLGAVRLCG